MSAQGNVQESFVFLFSSNTAIPQETATIQAKLDSMYFSAITTNKSNREITLDLLQALEGLVGVVTVTLFEDTFSKTVTYIKKTGSGVSGFFTWNTTAKDGRLHQLVSEAHLHAAGMLHSPFQRVPLQMIPLLMGLADRHTRRYFLVIQDLPQISDLRSRAARPPPAPRPATAAPAALQIPAPIQNTAPPASAGPAAANANEVWNRTRCPNCPLDFAARLLPHRPTHPKGMTDLSGHADFQMLNATPADQIIAEYSAWNSPVEYLAAKRRLIEEIESSANANSGVARRSVKQWSIWAGRKLKDGVNLRPEKCERIIAMFVAMGWLTVP